MSTALVSTARTSARRGAPRGPSLAVVGLLFVLAAQTRSPETAVAELLAADRAASAAASRADAVDALTAAMRADVMMPVPGRDFAVGIEAVRAALVRDTLDRASRAEWTPVRGGVSADGTHGFTFGFILVTRADGSTVPGKYLAYWIRDRTAWRMAAYRRVRRAAGTIDLTPLAPALPATLVAPSRDPESLAAHRESLMQAERDFARESQSVGLRAGFSRYGSVDAMNMGGAVTAGFVLGNEAIAAAVSAGAPEGTSPVNWGPDRALVASSGDLGITFGIITPNAEPAPGQARPRYPFFTVWRRAGPGAAWRYVAE